MQDMKTLTVRMDDKLHRDFKIVCAMLNVDMNAQLQALMVQFIAKHGDKLPLEPKSGK
jgi:antitoxin component of RelBE/YafQ-DinJ toxin-antitoxin module